MVQIAFSGSAQLVGQIIKGLTGGYVTHAFFIFHDRVFDTEMTLGAHAGGLTIIPLAECKDEILYVFEPIGPGLEVGLRKLVNLLNRPYDYQGLVGMSIVEAARAMGLDVENPLQSEHRLFCSEFAKMVVNESGYEVLPDVHPGSCDPAQLCDALLADPDHFRVVGGTLAEVEEQ